MLARTEQSVNRQSHCTTNDYIPRIDAATLKDQCDLRDIVRTLWGAPNRSHATHDVYRSRWRDDGQRPAFTVYEDGYKDYGGTGQSGDVFAFLMTDLNLSFPEAVQRLADYQGGHTPRHAPRSPAVSRHSATHEPPPVAWQRAMRRVIQDAQNRLWNAPDVLNYLRERRGLNDDTIREAGLGYNPEWIDTGYKNPHKNRPIWAAPGIFIPWEIDGVLYAVRIRTRVGHFAQALNRSDDTRKNGKALDKYLAITGSKPSMGLYGGDQLAPGCTALMMEGEFDVLLARQSLKDLVIITRGSATASNRIPASWLDRLKDCGKIYSLFDTDAAGDEATVKLHEALKEQHDPLQLPVGNDYTDYVITHRRDGTCLLTDAHPRAITVSSVQPPIDVGHQTISGNPTRAQLPSEVDHPEEEIQRQFTPVREHFPQGLPDSYRAALSRYFAGATARVVEVVVRGQLTEQLPDQLTPKAVAEYSERVNIHLSEAVVRKVFTVHGCAFFTKISNIHTDNISLNSSKNTRGRPQHAFQFHPALVEPAIKDYAYPRLFEQAHHDGQHPIAPYPNPELVQAIEQLDPHDLLQGDNRTRLLDQLAPFLEDSQCRQDQKRARHRANENYFQLCDQLNDTTYTPLPEGWRIESKSDYHAARLHVLLRDKEAMPLSRSDLIDILGCSDGTLDPIMQQAGIESKDNYQSLHVRHLTGIYQEIRDFGSAHRGKPFRIRVRTFDGQLLREVGYTKDTIDDILRAYPLSEHRIEINFRCPSLRKVVCETPPHEREPVGDDQSGQIDRDTVKPTRAQSTKPAAGTTKRRTRKRRPWYGKTYNPDWLRDSLKLYLAAMGQTAIAIAHTLEDMHTGIQYADDAPTLLAVLLGDIRVCPVDTPPVKSAQQIGTAQSVCTTHTPDKHNPTQTTDDPVPDGVYTVSTHDKPRNPCDIARIPMVSPHPDGLFAQPF